MPRVLSCKPAAIRMRRARSRHPEQHTDAVRTWRSLHPEAAMLNWVKSRAKHRRILFSLTIDDIRIPTICPVLGIALKPSVGKANAASPTLDRIDSTRGYVKGNVVVISHRANRLKSDASARELAQLASFYGELVEKSA